MNARISIKTFIHNIRRNWYWGRTHGWGHLIEEHDVNPLVNARRSLRKTKWRWTNRSRQTTAKPVFLVGAQRSGTNMLAHGLDEAPEFQVYNEGNARAFRNFRLRPLETIEMLIERSWAEFVLFKPLCDSQRALELLDRFQPKARLIWAYRDVDGRVRSALAKHGDSNLRVLRAYAAGEAKDAWQVQGVSAENAALIRSFDFNQMSADSAAALFWYIRNSLYFEMALDRRHDTVLASYNQLLLEPGRVVTAICAFLGFDYRRELIAHIAPRRPAWKEPLAIDHRIRQRCAELQQQLDSVSDAQMMKLIGERTIPQV